MMRLTLLGLAQYAARGDPMTLAEIKADMHNADAKTEWRLEAKEGEHDEGEGAAKTEDAGR